MKYEAPPGRESRPGAEREAASKVQVRRPETSVAPPGDAPGLARRHPAEVLWDDLLALHGARRDEYGNLADCCWHAFNDGRTIGRIEGVAAERAAERASWADYHAQIARAGVKNIDVMQARQRAKARWSK